MAISEVVFQTLNKFRYQYLNLWLWQLYLFISNMDIHVFVCHGLIQAIVTDLEMDNLRLLADVTFRYHMYGEMHLYKCNRTCSNLFSIGAVCSKVWKASSTDP